MATNLNKTNAATLAEAWGKFYHAALSGDRANIKAFGEALKRAQAKTGVTLWEDEMIDLKVAELTAKNNA